MDVMLYEVFAEEEEALKRYLPLTIEVGFSKHTIQIALTEMPPARLISTRTQSIIPHPWAKHLSGILTRSSGFDHLQVFLSRCGRKIPCGYLPTYCARAVAEQTVLMILALRRRLTRQLRQFASFERDHLTGSECAERTLVVVGVGHIGTEIAQVGAGLGMRVKGVDLSPRVPWLEYVTLEEGIELADVLVCALPLTKATNRLLGYDALRRAKPGLIFVNIARGEISPLQDLMRLLDEGVLGGLGLDVYEEESVLAEALRAKRGVLPETADLLLALQQDERVLCTPHNAFNTREALERKAQQSCEAIVAFLQRGTFPHAVPADSASHSRDVHATFLTPPG